MSAVLHVGLLINPLAGLGGSLALKGSDGERLRELAGAMAPAQRSRARERARRALAVLAGNYSLLRFTTWTGPMGGDLLADMGLPARVLGANGNGLTSAADTRAAAGALVDAGIDLLVFAGGDGTARDIVDAIGQRCPVLGIPAGVKMHSGVFAVSPEAAGQLLLQLARGGLVGIRLQEVRDIDEEAFRHDVVRSRFYGELNVPAEGRFLQHTKVGGKESVELATAEIAAWVVECMQAGVTYLVGPGSTTAAIMEELGLDNTLLGVDVVRDGVLLASDADEQTLLRLLAAMPGEARMIVTVIGGQGHVFGRGNQQLSPAVIRAVGIDHIILVATRTKIIGLGGRPLLVDTNDPDLDRMLCGFHSIVTGYDDQLMYRVAQYPDAEGESDAK